MYLEPDLICEPLNSSHWLLSRHREHGPDVMTLIPRASVSPSVLVMSEVLATSEAKRQHSRLSQRKTSRDSHARVQQRW